MVALYIFDLYFMLSLLLSGYDTIFWILWWSILSENDRISFIFEDSNSDAEEGELNVYIIAGSSAGGGLIIFLISVFVVCKW